MKILYVVPNPPSLVRVRPYNLIRALQARGHEVVIATVCGSREELGEVEQLRRQGQRVLAAPLSKPQIMRNLVTAVLHGAPLQARYSFSPGLADEISRLLKSEGEPRPDVVHIEHLRGAVYAPLIARLRTELGVPLPMIWDSVDCISYLFGQAAVESRSLKGRLMALVELPRTRRYEGQLLSRFDHSVVTSKPDLEAFGQLPGGNRPAHSKTDAQSTLSVLPNGVDLNYFTPGTGPRDAETLIFSGKMSYHANVTAVCYLIQDIMPLVWQRRPDVRLVIAGKDPVEEVLAAARQHGPRVVVTGTVPDMRPFLWQATVAVVPLVYGAGIQNKVLEAMACGAPVVATPRAVAALEVSPGADLLLAESAAGFADAVVRLLEDADWRQRIAASGRGYVERCHDWRNIAGILEGIYEQAVAAAKEAAGR